MKKISITLLILTLVSNKVIAQVGINTASPTTTLDIVAKNPTGTSTASDGLLIPRVDRQRAQSMTGVQASTLIYVNSVSTGSQADTAANIDTLGYYYFNGTVWVKLNSGSATSNNIYTTDGTLAGNRVVTQADKKLSFTASSVDAFNVASGTLSVDAANKRVGIGTTAPANVLVAKGTNAQPSALGTAKTNATLRVDGSSNHALDLGTFSDLPYGSYISSQNKTTTTPLPLVLNPVGGNVGIQTTTPQKALHINGALQLTKELNVGGNSSTAGSSGTSGQILFSQGEGAAPKWDNFNIPGVPKTSIYYLPNNQSNFLNTASVGDSQVIPVTVSIDAADGVTYNTNTNTFNFSKAGYYRFSLTYEADHNATNCTVSSYFADFPDNDSQTVRIHTTASHNQGANSNHGGTIVYASRLPANSTWKVALGRGQSGSCTGPGMLLKGKSTIVEISSVKTID